MATQVRHGVDARADPVQAGIEIPVAADIGGHDVALDPQHEGTALPAIAADHATQDSAGPGRAAGGSEIVVHRGAANRASQPPPLEHVLGRKRGLVVDRRESGRRQIGGKGGAGGRGACQ